MNITKKFSMLFGMLFVIVGLVGLQAPAYADDSIEIESTSFAETSAKAEVNSVTRATINGAEQVTWQDSNHNVRVTKRMLKKAPKFKINAPGANSSVKIYKKAKRIDKRSAKVKGVNVVVLKKGSCVRNTGMLNRLRVGFVWCLKHDAVLVLDGRSHQYRHAFNIVGGKLVKTCLNYIGGKVPMKDKVVQVRYELDVLEDIEIEAAVDVTAKVKASLECPTGTLEGEASASASASATASIRVKVREKVSAVNAKQIELLTKVRADAKVKAQAEAVAKITLTCSDNPQPPDFDEPTIDLTAGACVEPGQATGVITAVVGNPNDEASPATVTTAGQTKDISSVPAGGSSSVQFTGLAPGTYTVRATLTKFDTSASASVTINECDVPEDNPPVVNIMGSPAHLYVNGNAAIWIEAFDPDGDAVSVQVNGSGAGYVAGLVESDVRWDGTPCPSGKNCYRATAWAGPNPGTFTITATVTAKGKSDTATVSFPVVADEF